VKSVAGKRKRVGCPKPREKMSRVGSGEEKGVTTNIGQAGSFQRNSKTISGSENEFTIEMENGIRVRSNALGGRLGETGEVRERGAQRLRIPTGGKASGRKAKRGNKRPLCTSSELP